MIEQGKQLSATSAKAAVPVIVFGIDASGKAKAGRFLEKHAALAAKAAAGGSGETSRSGDGGRGGSPPLRRRPTPTSARSVRPVEQPSPGLGPPRGADRTTTSLRCKANLLV